MEKEKETNGRWEGSEENERGENRVWCIIASAAAAVSVALALTKSAHFSEVSEGFPGAAVAAKMKNLLLVKWCFRLQVESSFADASPVCLRLNSFPDTTSRLIQSFSIDVRERSAQNCFMRVRKRAFPIKANGRRCSKSLSPKNERRDVCMQAMYVHCNIDGEPQCF